jgi:undecaprenyl-diphosphatase
VAFDGGLEAIQPIDDWWHDSMVTVENGTLTLIAKSLDVVGGAIVIWPVRMMALAFLATARRWALFVTFATITLLSEVAIGLFKGLYDRPRPADSLVETSGSAFPSGHATATAATAVGLVIVLFAPGEHRRVWEIRAGLAAFVMALSRTYLRAHWLSDVLAGALLGAATAVAVAALVHVIRVRMHLERQPAP